MPKRPLSILIVCLFTLLINACSQATSFEVQGVDSPKMSQHAVAMPDKFAAQVALDIMNSGGNAVDAAIAAQFSLAVTFPEAGNIGGGGFMVIHFNKQNDFIDYRETAPEKAHRDMYLDENGDVMQFAPIYGPLASGVPGTVSGMWEAHKKYGSLPWANLVQPAVSLAENGFVMPEKLANSISRYIVRLEKRNLNLNFAKYFGHAKAGEVFKQPELAATLSRIRDLGFNGFYQGETAKIIAQFMQNEGGLISEQDLANYQAKWREPIVSNWREYEVVSSAPPSSGGIAVAQWLQMYDLVKQRSPALSLNHANYIHILAEIGKRVFADRAEYLGDPDFFDVPKEELLENDYLQHRASSILLDQISDTSGITAGLPESEETTHFSIVDSKGNAVSNTTTINLGFGSGVVVEGAGFILNDEMDDFSAKAGVPNYFGAVGGKANEIQANKRMLSSMTPTIVLKDGALKMVTGSPGGTTIMSSVYLSILHALEFNLPAQEIVDTPRFHHQLFPVNEIRHHVGLSSSTISELRALGYKTRESRFGDLHVIVVRDGKLQAASEANGRGKAQVQNADFVKPN